MTLEPLEMPEALYDADRIVPNHPADPLVVALNRLAAAVETYNRSQGHLGAVEPSYAPLPPSNGVQARPACPKHGTEKVKPSRNGQGFYCSAKDPSTAKGWCVWQS